MKDNLKKLGVPFSKRRSRILQFVRGTSMLLSGYLIASIQVCAASKCQHKEWKPSMEDAELQKKCMQAFERRKLFVLFTLIFELSSLSMYWSENIAPEPKTANFPPVKSEYTIGSLF